MFIYNIIKEFFYRIKFFELKFKSVFFLILLTILSVFVEMFGISLFLPIFEYIRLEGDINYLLENSFIWQYLYNFYNFFNIEVSLIYLLFTVILLFLFRQIFNFIKLTYRAKINFTILQKLRKRILKSYLESNLNKVENLEKGYVFNLFTEQSGTSVLALLAPIEFLSYCIMAIGYVFLMGFISLPITIIAIILLIFTLILPRRYIFLSGLVGKKLTDINLNIGSFFLTRIQAFKLIKITSNTEKENNKFNQLSLIQRENSIMGSILSNKMDLIVEPFIIILSIIFIYFAFTYFHLTIETLGIYLFIILRLIPVFRSMLLQIQNMKSVEASIAVVIKNLNEFDNNRESNLGKEQYKNIQKGIEFNKVSFAYDQMNNILKDVNLFIPSNSIVAFVGPTGTGKSTILDLLTKLRLPTKGNIFIDDIDLQDYENTSLRSNISFSSQKPDIINVSIRDYIQFSNFDKKESNLDKILELADLSEFIKNLPEGLDTLIK